MKKKKKKKQTAAPALSLDERELERIEKFQRFFTKHQRLPNPKATDSEEAALGRWVRLRRNCLYHKARRSGMSSSEAYKVYVEAEEIKRAKRQKKKQENSCGDE